MLPASAIAAASTAVLAETYGIVRILLYICTVPLYSCTVHVQYRECLGIPSQCFFSPKMSDSGGLQDAMQYDCTVGTAVDIDIHG